MGDAVVKIKLMPDSPDANLDEIEKQAREILEKADAKAITPEQQPIAFGLVALILTFLIPETFEQDPIEEALSKIEHVSSVQIIDFRRAFG